ncbi:MAG: hypothetical protein ABIZ81_08590 [Opitutaceae bacterium]
MKTSPFILIGAMLCATPLRAEPDFPAHGFKSSLALGDTWKVRQQFDETKLDMVMRAYADAEGIRSITLILGRNNTDVKELASFTDRWKKGFQKPTVTFTDDKAGRLGGIPARLITAEAVLETGVRHILALLAIYNGKVYTVILTSDRKPPAEDEVLSAFLRSIQIGAQE